MAYKEICTVFRLTLELCILVIDALKMMLSCASCMNLALIHEILPDKGRQLSVLFSPSLSNNQAVKKKLERPDRCVCCKRRTKLASRRSKAVATTDLDALDSEGDDAIDEVDIEDDIEGLGLSRSDHESDRNLFWQKTIEDEKRQSNKKPGTGDILPIDATLCRFSAEADICHYACTSCIADMKKEDKFCPLCKDLLERSGCLNGTVETAKIDDCTDTVADEGVTPDVAAEHVYCKGVFGGFVASKKLHVLLDNFKTKVPVSDKVLLVSFFKGTLDLLEAMFHANNIGVARFDGDIKANEREAQLNRFKTSPLCRILLMTAHTGGTGLNIVEANHVWFADRYCMSIVQMILMTIFLLQII